ncbi:MAG TPA: hypothetical protein VN666_11215 [Nitrospira sp.]|nr:hypothetical protein [Nitrospira sp.]
MPGLRRITDDTSQLYDHWFSCSHDQRLRHILFVHEHIGQETIVDIPAMRHDANRAVAQQLFQPPLGRLALK